MDEQSNVSAEWDMKVVGEPPILWITATGRFDLAHWLELMSAVPSIPGFRPGLKSLVDARQAHLDLSGEDVGHLASMVRQHVEDRGGSGFKSAHVASGDLSFGLSRMLQVLAEDEVLEFSVFRSLEEAMEWLSPETRGVL